MPVLPKKIVVNLLKNKQTKKKTLIFVNDPKQVA